jgi:hypothetical protein
MACGEGPAKPAKGLGKARAAWSTSASVPDMSNQVVTVKTYSRLLLFDAFGFCLLAAMK